MRTTIVLLTFLAACSGSSTDPAAAAQAWPEADVLFHSDGRWLGGTNAASVDLGGARTLWLFGNSHVDPLATGDRSLAFLVANTIAIQTGRDPTTAAIEFHWGDAGGDPAAFFPDENGEWFWPVAGIRVAGALTVFGTRNRFDPFGVPFRFAVVRAEAFRVDDPDAPPAAWSPRRVPLPAEVNAVLREGGFVHGYTVGGGAHDTFLLRWDEASFVNGDLASPEWWDGQGWVRDASLARRVLREGADQFSVTRHAGRGRLVLVESHGFEGSFLADKLTLRLAPDPEGPWGALQELFRPEEARRGFLTPGGRAHPHLVGADLVATYVPDADGDPELGFPRFVRITFEDR